MTTLQREVGVPGRSLLADGDCFDMWHDYMDLGRLLGRLCVRHEQERGDSEGPKQEPAAPWSHVRASSAQRDEELKSSAETSSASSLSDTSSSSSSGASPDYCRFCKQNGETPGVFWSHKLKSDDGKITCPILRNYTCPTCEATGDYAHTRRYCPQVQRKSAAKIPPRSRFW